MKRFLALSAVLFLANCTPPQLDNLGNIGKESDPTRFYTLTAAPMEPAEPVMSSLVLGVGPVSVTDYLDRSHIVVRKSETQLDLADFDRWAGNLSKEIQRVLGANLSARLGTEQVVSYPWKSGISTDMTVEMTVERFEYDTGGKVWLVASWQVFGDNGRNTLAFRRSSLSRVSGDDYEEIAASLSALLGELSAQMTNVIRSQNRLLPQR